MSRPRSTVSGAEANGTAKLRSGKYPTLSSINHLDKYLLTGMFLCDRFLMRLTNDDTEVNLGNGEADLEFAEWKWATPQEVIEQVILRLILALNWFGLLIWEWKWLLDMDVLQAVDYKRPTYEQVFTNFEPYFMTQQSAKCKSTKWWFHFHMLSSSSVCSSCFWSWWS